MELIPLADRVIVKEETAEEKIGHFIIPDSYKKNTNQGIVTAVGPGIDKPVNVKVGDRVLFQKNTGAKYELSENNIITVLDELDLICIIKDAS